MSTEPTAAGAAAEHAAVERLAADENLAALEALVGGFNLFEALGVGRAEIRHSNFLAFLLDPLETHGQGDLFLKALLADMLALAPATARPVSQADLSGADLRGADVRREWKGIDVLVVFRSPPFVVVIENKIDSDEHSDQLRRYRDTVTRHYPHSRVLCVYLTPDGDDPSDASWLVYTYGHVFRLLERLRRDHAGAFGGDLKVVLDHYLQLLGTRFMHDPRIDDLCRTVYKKHRQALDLIWERVRGLATGLMADVAYAAREDAWWDVVHENDKVVNLVPKAWYDWLPGIGELYDDPRVWVVLKIQAFDGRLGWFVELQGILEHKGRRKRIGETLVAAAPGLGFEPTTGRKPTANFAKVTGVETVLEWGRAEQPDPETIRTAVRKLLEEVRPKFDSLEAVLKPLRT